MSTSYKTLKPKHASTKINRRAATELGVRALWSAGSSLITYDLIQTEKPYQLIDAGLPTLFLSASGWTNRFSNAAGGPKNSNAAAWVCTDAVQTNTNVITLFAVFSTTDTSSNVNKWVVSSGGLRLGYNSNLNVVIAGAGNQTVVFVPPHTLTDGLEHTMSCTLADGVSAPRVTLAYDGVIGHSGGGLSASTILAVSNLVVGAKGVGENESWNGNISLAGQSDVRWTYADHYRFAFSPFELLHQPQRRTKLAPVVLPPGQIDARSWTLAPVIAADSLLVNPVLQARTLQTLPVVDAEDIEVEPVVGSREIHTLPVIDEDD